MRWAAKGILLLCGLALPASLFAHLALSGSSPSAGATLAEVPTEVRLDFTEAVELSLSSLELIGPEGEVELSELQGEEGGRLLRALIVGEMGPGVYAVRWQAVGRDGHPVRGEFGFEVEAIAAVEAPVVAPPPPESAPEATIPPVGAFDAESPLYAVVRWVNYAGIVATTGVAAFILLLVRLADRSGSGIPSSLRDGVARGATLLGLFAVLLVALALALRLQAQARAVFGGGIDSENFPLLLSSGWGRAWLLQAIAASIVLAGLGVASKRLRPGMALIVPGAILLSFSPALSGHAAAVESLPLVAMGADGLHVLAAGCWLGTLLVFVLVGVPHLRKLPHSERPVAYSSLLAGFSSIALLSGALILATGVVSTSFHLEAPADLWRSGYGRLLLAKLLVVLTVFAVGAFNWRRLPGGRERPGAEATLRRNGAMELTAALVVLALTAFLVAVPPPASAAPGEAITPTVQE